MPTNYIDKTPKISTYKIREGIDSQTGKVAYQPYYFWTTAAAVAEVNVATGVEGRFFTHITSTSAQEGELITLKTATVGSTTYLRPEASGVNISSLAKSATITIAANQIISQSPVVVNPTAEQIQILEDLSTTEIKVDLSAIYTSLGIDSPYAWIRRNATRNLGTTTNGAVAYEFICSGDDINASGELTKIGSLDVYYFYQTIGSYASYDKKIIISNGKITLSTISHATNLSNGSGTGALIQQKYQDTFTTSNPNATGYTGTQNVEAAGNYSFVQGGYGRAVGAFSHVEGERNIAVGNDSHAEGYSTFALGTYSHAEGLQTSAKGNASHAEGVGTVASADYQHVMGKFNAEDNSKVFIIGNGDGTETSTGKVNVFTVGFNGDVTATSYTGAWTGDPIPVSRGGTGLSHIGAGQMLIGGTEGDEYTTVTLQNSVVANSNNPVTSGAVFAALSEVKQNILVVWSESDYADTEIPTPQMLARIPNAVTVKYASGTQTAQGSLSPSASVKNNIYFIYDKNGNQDKFDEYVATPEYDGSSTYVWEKIGDTGINLNGYIYKDTTSGSYQANKILISSDTDGKVTATIGVATSSSDIVNGSTLSIPNSKSVKDYVGSELADKVYSTDQYWVGGKLVTTIDHQDSYELQETSYQINGSTWGSSATTSIPTTALVSSRATKVYASIDEPTAAIEGDIWIEIENTGS